MRNFIFAGLGLFLVTGCVSRKAYLKTMDENTALTKKYKTLEDNFYGCLSREAGDKAELDMYRSMFRKTMELQHSVDPTKK